MDFQIIAAIVFIVVLSIFLYFKRKNLELQKIIFPILYVVLYRTKLGLKAMDSLARKFPKFWKIFSVLGIVVGFLGMAFISFELIKQLVNMLITPQAQAGVAMVLPIPVKGAIYVPFFYWIACIFIIAGIHEFSHGVVSRFHKIRIKSSGFAFFGVVLPVIPAAFVEPDEEQMKQKKAWRQLGVFAAGPFANIILGLLSLLVIMFVINPVTSMAIDNSGIIIQSVLNESPGYSAGLLENDVILSVDNTSIVMLSNFTDYISTKSPGDIILFKTNRTETEVVLGSNSENSSKAFIGITFLQNTELKESFVKTYGSFTPKLIYWISEFFFWLYLLNIGIGLFNLVPLGPVDVGRMLRVALLSFLPEQKADKLWKAISFAFLGIILFMLFFPMLKSTFASISSTFIFKLLFH